jgi:hypothetical protein
MNDTDFDTWMRQVDECIGRRCGLSSSDLPDWTYRDAFDDGLSPEEAAAEALDNAQD